MGKKNNKKVGDSEKTLTYLERKLKVLNEMENRALARRLAERLYMNYKEKKV